MFCFRIRHRFDHVDRFLHRFKEQVMATLQEVKDALAEAKDARVAADKKADAALELLVKIDKELDDLKAAGGATPADLDELRDMIKGEKAAIVAQGDEAQAAIDAANASNPPPPPPP